MRTRVGAVGFVVVAVAVATGAAVVAGARAIGPRDEPEGLKELAKARADIARRQVEIVEQSRGVPARAGEPGRGIRGAVGIDMDEYVAWSRRWMDAQLDLAETPAERAVAIQEHIDRLEKQVAPIRRLVDNQAANIARREVEALEFQVLEAKSLLARERRGARPAPR